MPIEKTPTPAPGAAQTADREDGGWAVESASAAAGAAPADTTAEAIAAEAQAAEPVAEPEGDAEGEAAEHAAAGETPAEPVAATTEKPVAKGTKKAKGPSWQQRVDALTKNWRTEQETRQRLEQEREDLRRRLETLERGAVAPAAAAPERPGAGTEPPAIGPIPEPPHAADYVTDDEYQAAITKWRADVDTWQTAREARLKTQISTELETRRTADQQNAAAAAQARAVADRLARSRAAHPDWDEQREANKAIIDNLQSPFLQYLVQASEDGGELLYDLISDPDFALAAADLQPTGPLADTLRLSPTLRPLMRYFATPEGRILFSRLRVLPPPRVAAEVGKLEARLEAADRGSASGAPEPITGAIPPAKPPVGTPRARQGPTSPAGAPTESFDDWMAQEDRREAEAKRQSLRAMGLAV